MVPKIINICCFHIFFSLQLCLSMARNDWIRVGFYSHAPEFPVSSINFSLFTHLVCSSAAVNSTSYELSITPADEQYFSTFTQTVKEKGPSVTTLLSIQGREANYSRASRDQDANYSIFSSMVSNSSYRKSFIDSSIKIARLYGFQGLEFNWHYPSTISDTFRMGVLFEEWKVAIGLEAADSNQSELILTARVSYSPSLSMAAYPIVAIQKHLNWVHVTSQFYTQPTSSNLTGAHAALYNPSNFVNTNFGLTEWIDGGLSANKLVLSLPYFGFAWTLEHPKENGIGAAAKGPAIEMKMGLVKYNEIKNYIKQYGPDVHVKYNSTYVVNYWTKGTIWIGFDDVEAIRAKVSYVKDKKLLGYAVYKVSYDASWVLSDSACNLIKEEAVIKNSSVPENLKKNGQNDRRPLLAILLSTTAAVTLLSGIFVTFYCWRRNLISKGIVDTSTESNVIPSTAAAAGDFYSNDPNLKEYALEEIEAATNRFSIKNKLGQGGYGPVYKGILPDGQAIAVKKLSKTSTQGFEEFENEVSLTAKLQHVNLVQVLGFCVDREEQILIYPYMKNRSLDTYLFDPIRRFILDWKKRVHIIEGVTQGLLYLQEYSRMTIIHRDLKPSNVLLDGEMKPKISDFGIAKMFAKDDVDEANTSRIIGTIGYVPPEYVNYGTYSTKSDVYGFGVLLLQIISGKRTSLLYGPNKDLTLPDYAYELWNSGKGMEFMDDSLDDTNLSCKLIRCLRIALLCVQENPDDRPSMSQVFGMLKSENTSLMTPKKPTFSEQNEQSEATVLLEGYTGSSSSINDVTTSYVAFCDHHQY